MAKAVRRLLHINASARPGISGTNPYGSHTRRLTQRFIDRWLHARPDDEVIHRDVGQEPPSPITAAWISAVFTPVEHRDAFLTAQLSESDCLIAELFDADIVVIGVPMYNFGVPAQLKAWIDNVVRVGVTVSFDPSQTPDYYSPMLPAGKRLVLLCSKGDHGYDAGGRLEEKNLAERSVVAPMKQIGFNEIYSVSAEYSQFSDDRFAQSIMRAEEKIDDIVLSITGRISRV